MMTKVYDATSHMMTVVGGGVSRAMKVWWWVEEPVVR